MKKLFVGIGVVLIAAYVGITAYAENIAEKQVNQAVANAARYADVDYGNISVDLFGLDVHISNVDISPKQANKQGIHIHEIVIHDLDKQSNIPSFLDISLHGIESDGLKQALDWGDEMKALGYNENMIFNIDLAYHYNRDDKEIKFNTHMHADDVGDLKFTTRLGNLNLSRNDIMRLPATFHKIMIYNGKINYDDDSLIDRVYEFQAKQQRISVAQIKNNDRKSAEKDINNTKDPAIRDALKGLSDFFAEPESISISMTPEKPVPLGRVMRTTNQNDIIKLLNIEIES